MIDYFSLPVIRVKIAFGMENNHYKLKCFLLRFISDELYDSPLLGVL